MRSRCGGLLKQLKSNLKLYRHYKNKPYKYLGVARYSETLEELVIYETLYENELSTLWARPKEMFFENVETEGKSRPRFQQIELDFRVFEETTSETKQQITDLLQLVLDEFDPEKFELKLRDKTKIMLLAAYEGQKLAGFKLGYQLNKTRFYSWLGAVSPEYRNIGLSKELLLRQHEWCRENKYEVIETKTMNKWKTTLHLNIDCGFLITGTEKNQRGETKILMEKRIA